MAEIKELPILFKAEMIRAILDGQKTQTRRVITPQPKLENGVWLYKNEIFVSADDLQSYLFHDVYGNYGTPYGSAYGDGTGDHLWVRETLLKFYRDPPTAQHKATATAVLYAEGAKQRDATGRAVWQWKRDTLPSIFMPKWATRLWLKVKDVRVERVQNISMQEAIKEGITIGYKIKGSPEPRVLFMELWNEINQKRGYGWDTNPFCWVIEFERIEHA